MLSRLHWAKGARRKQCMMPACKRDSLLGSAWCRKHLRQQLESARKLLRTWRILSARQNAIVMAKINRTLQRMLAIEAEKLAEKLENEGKQ